MNPVFLFFKVGRAKDVGITALITAVAVILYLRGIVPLLFLVILLTWHMLLILRLKAELSLLLQSAFMLVTVPLLLFNSLQESFTTALLLTFLAAGIVVHGSRHYPSKIRRVMLLLSLAVWIFPLLHPERKLLEAVVAIPAGIILTVIVALAGDKNASYSL